MVSLSSGPTPSGGDPGPPLSSKLRQIFLNRVALTIPLLITLMVLAFLVNFILQTISPVVAFVSSEFGVGSNISPLVMELLAIATSVVLIFVIGLVAESRSGDGFERVFDVDLSVEGGIRSIVTGGVATGERDPETLDGELLGLDEDEIDEQAAVRHYMLNRTHESGATPETTLSPDESLDESVDAADPGGANRPTEQDSTAGDAVENDSQTDGEKS